jgi:UDP-sulfoquinovose synthase
LLTRFDFDQAFGTAINRFCAQAVIGLPITPYGKGTQKRGFLPLKDSIQCFTLAIENPPEEGEYRVFNQFEETYHITELADKVKFVAKKLGLDPEIRHLENPRVEKEEHYFNPDHQKLLDLGYQPTRDMNGEIKVVLQELMNYSSRIEARKEALLPDISWDGQRQKSKYI